MVVGMHTKIRSLKFEMNSSNSERFDDNALMRTVVAAKGPLRHFTRYHVRMGIENDPSSAIQIVNGCYDIYSPFNRRYEKAKVVVKPQFTIRSTEHSV